MSKLLWKSLLVSPAILGVVLASSANAAGNQVPVNQLDDTVAEVSVEESSDLEASATTEAAPELNFAVPQETPVAQADNSEIINQINEYSGDSNALDQVTSVNQLSDIDPFWFSAVQKMVDKYGCIVGYPDGTFKGQRNITRYEFAAAVSRCMEWVEENIGSVDAEGLATLRRLVQEFEAELAVLGARVDDLEGRVAFVEDHQFSTTTKLRGEVIFAVTDEFGTATENNTVFVDRGRLTLDTSFTGEDSLITRLAFGNSTAFNTGTNSAEATQTFDIGGGGGNNVSVDWLAYYFPFGASQVYVAAFGGIWSDIAPTLNPYFEDYDGGNGALTAFASENPIYRIGGGSGAAVSLGVGLLESVLGPSTVTFGYLAGNASDPSAGEGLFDGDYAALGQINFNLGDRIGLGATYVHGFHNNGSAIYNLGGVGASGVVGTGPANLPHITSPVGAAVTNSYGLEAAFRLTEKISISGFGVYTDVISLQQGDTESWSYGAGVAFNDLGKEGSILGIFGGAQPYSILDPTGAVAMDGGVALDDVPYTVEAFYKYQVNDNISVTPGVIWITNPNQNSEADDAWIGTLRTTFTF
ncbi:MAG: iron uptake porin [Spirulinaceae cyanobacterium]